MKTLKIVLVRPYQKFHIENRMCSRNHFQPVCLQADRMHEMLACFERVRTQFQTEHIEVMI